MNAPQLLGQAEIGKVHERPWGRYIILEIGNGYLVKRIEIDSGRRFSLQLHNHRAEEWIVVAGLLKITIDDLVFEAGPGRIAQIEVGQKHRAECVSEETAVFIEVQRGDYLAEDDIVRFEDDFGRA